MKKIFVILIVVLIVSPSSAQRVALPNPIMFVAQVPIPQDSATLTSPFCNHKAEILASGRGSDLYIIYPDGSMKNLTLAAGYGMSGFQGANAIAVRDPSIDWSGKRAVFSMIVGAALHQGEQTDFHWQIYEITGIGENETPVITKVPNQPADFNNISPIYGTDERIIFTSDRPRFGEAYLYPSLDEQFAFPAITGLWSLDPESGNLFQMNISPSGAFTPSIDSYDRVVFTRWDLLQRDNFVQSQGRRYYEPFNYSDESASGINTGSTNEVFPEPMQTRQDLLKGTNLKGFSINQLFPWQINEDGTSEETLNHIGRHELIHFFNGSVNDDTNVIDFNSSLIKGLNWEKSISNFLQISEDPVHPGIYYGVSASGFDHHSCGQIISLQADLSLDPSQMALTYITDPRSSSPSTAGSPTDSTFPGHFRNPLPLSDGRLLAVHTPTLVIDTNIGTRAYPKTRYSLRIKTLKRSGDFLVADSIVTSGISKTVSYWDPDTLVTYSGEFWELDPVEVKARIKPTQRISTLGTPESQVFIEEGVDETAFRSDLVKNNLSLIVSRNVTHRDASDHQQPYFLKVHNSATQSANPHGKIYDASYAQFYQGDNIRGYMTNNLMPVLGRRILAKYIHDSAFAYNPHIPDQDQHSVPIASDGSFAAYVPPDRALAWAVTDSAFTPIVRERYWVTFQPGEIRVCGSCHGTNDEALHNIDPAPQNKPEALRSLLKYWKSSHTPLSTELVYPPNDSGNIPLQTIFTWQRVPTAKSYQLTLSITQDFSQVLFTSPQLTDTSYLYPTTKDATYFWRVLASDDGGNTAYSGIWKFTAGGPASVPGKDLAIAFSNHPNPFNTSTTVDFLLPEPGGVKLKMFNILGEEVAAVADRYFDEGKHSILWDGSRLPAGIYYIRMQYNGAIIMRKLQIVR